MLQILFQDDEIIAIHKPAKMLVHRSDIDSQETVFVLQTLRDQLGFTVFPVHRLDKPTSGILLFATNPEAAKQLGLQFQENKINKTYWLVCRGFVPDSGVIDHGLIPKDDFKSMRKKGRKKTIAASEPLTAITRFKTLSRTEIDVSIDKYQTSRYSLVEAYPETGRKHQIRRHFKHIAHPIIGDIRFGKGPHNRYFANQLQCSRLLLHSYQIELKHPTTNNALTIICPPDNEFLKVLSMISLQ